ncbi:MAG: efflux RND transporter periplasmic adaptor subunit [Nitrospinae bacterium]|nr:efflux RND transporter periplasmic adaptor subunit [Nitrospinota bacterium]
MKKYALLVMSFCLLIFTFTACEKKEVKAITEKVISVQVHPVKKKSLRPFINNVGTLNPFEEVTVSSEVDGILRDVNVDNGSGVSKGMVLAVIDDTDYNLEVERGMAALKQAEASLSNIKLEYQRKEELYKKELLTKQQYDDVTARLSIAEAELERAKSSISTARQKLSKTKIYSTLFGVVKEKKVSSGNYVKNGTPLLVIIQTNPVKLDFTVNEKDLEKIKKGQDVFFTVYAFPDKEFKGKLNIIYPSVDERTRTLKVEALVPNDAQLLKPGFFAKIMLYTGAAKDIFLVPVTSLLYEEEKIKVFVVEGDKARERFVKIGQKYRLQSEVGSRESEVESQESEITEFVEVVKGLKEGEQVVVVGQQNLFEGAKIKIVGGKD